MITVSTVATEAYRKLGRPSQLDMPYQDIIDTTREVMRGLTLDLKLSARSHTTTVGSWVAPSTREMAATSFTGGSDIIPVKAEWRPVDADDTFIPYPAEICAFEQLDYLAAKGDRAYLAFYDGFTNVKFSDHEDVITQREYRITYESLSDVPIDDKDDQAELPELFGTYLAEEVIIRSLDYVENNSPEWMEKRERIRSIILPSLMENRDRFRKWSRGLHGLKLQTKVGFQPRRSYR